MLYINLINILKPIINEVTLNINETRITNGGA